MKLYHGGLVDIQNPKIMSSNVGRDFGPAFYTTDIREQAERWALRREYAAKRNGDFSARAIVTVFEFDERQARVTLKVKDFPEASSEWLDLVLRCRSNKDMTHEYDIVTGKIANDNVGETVAFVLAGIMRREDALERLRFQKINNQLAFCTEDALKALHYEFSYEVKHD